MSSIETLPARTSAGAYTISLASDAAQIRAAQRLRYQIYTNEIGASLHTAAELDADEFDEVCDHLIVQHQPTAEVVGTYRLLPPGRAQQLYSESEFDLTALDPLRPALVEAGRSSVHPDHRGGAVINMMWSALARYTLLRGHRYLAGCASVPLDDGGDIAAGTWQLAERRHACPPDLRVHPHVPWQADREFTGPASYADLPALLRGYLRLGALVCGPPAHDPEFGVADFFVLLRLDDVNERYLRYFLGEHR